MPDVRARSYTEILDAAFEIYRRHFPTLFTIAAIGITPYTCAYFFAPGMPAQSLGLFYLLLFVGVLFNLFIESALIVAASRAYLGTGDVDVADAFRTGLAHPGRVLYVTWSKGLHIGLGFVALIVPGFYMVVRYFAIPATAVLEDLPAKEAVKRSRELSEGYGKRILGVLVLAWVAYWMIAGVATAIGVTMLSNELGELLVRFVVGGLAFPFIAVVETLLYYDIRIRKEGFDVELMAAELDAPAVA